MLRFKENPAPQLAKPLEPVTSCKICGAASYPFDVTDFNKFCSAGEDADCYRFGLAGVPVYYYACSGCGFVFTRFFDDWRDELFVRYIYNDEYHKVDGDYLTQRPQRCAHDIAIMLKEVRHLSILDYGSGSGAMAAELQRLGFADVERYDPYTSGTRPDRVFDVLTAVEVAEHCVDPIQVFSDMAAFLKPTGCMLFTTELQPDNVHKQKASWWYISPRNGHISIYNSLALDLVASKVGMKFDAMEAYHLFRPGADSAVPGWLAAKLTRRAQSLMLYAPTENASGQWHDLETAAEGRFRWTGVDEIRWQIGAVTGRWTVFVPLLFEITPGFASQSWLRAGFAQAKLQLIDMPFRRMLRADIEIDLPRGGEVALLTPQPLRPCDIGGSADTRPMGLAIGAAP